MSSLYNFLPQDQFLSQGEQHYPSLQDLINTQLGPITKNPSIKMLSNVRGLSGLGSIGDYNMGTLWGADNSNLKKYLPDANPVPAIEPEKPLQETSGIDPMSYKPNAKRTLADFLLGFGMAGLGSRRDNFWQRALAGGTGYMAKGLDDQRKGGMYAQMFGGNLPKGINPGDLTGDDWVNMIRLKNAQIKQNLNLKKYNLDEKKYEQGNKRLEFDENKQLHLMNMQDKLYKLNEQKGLVSIGEGLNAMIASGQMTPEQADERINILAKRGVDINTKLPTATVNSMITGQGLTTYRERVGDQKDRALGQKDTQLEIQQKLTDLKYDQYELEQQYKQGLIDLQTYKANVYTLSKEADLLIKADKANKPDKIDVLESRLTGEPLPQAKAGNPEIRKTINKLRDYTTAGPGGSAPAAKAPTQSITEQGVMDRLNKYGWTPDNIAKMEQFLKSKGLSLNNFPAIVAKIHGK